LRSCFAKIEEIGCADGQPDQQEPATADIARHRVRDGECKPGSYRGIHGVASVSEYREADVRGGRLLRDHHATFGGNWFFAGTGSRAHG